jgi:tetratricopeptide (TPR) repeat protein
MKFFPNKKLTVIYSLFLFSVVFVFIISSTKCRIAYHFNYSALQFLSGDTSKALQQVSSQDCSKESLASAYYYHNFLLSQNSVCLSRAFYAKPSSFFYLMSYTDQFMNEREWIKARPFFYSIRWARYLTRKGMELANKTEEDSAYRGLFYLLFAKKISPNTRISHDLGSVLAFRHQAYHKGEALLLEALKKDNRNAQVYRSFGRLYQKKNQTALAISYYECARRLDPGNNSNYIDIARIYRDEKSYEQAINWYNSAQKLDPFQETAYYEKARIYTLLDEKAKAFAEYRQIVFLLPEKQNPRYQWGVFLYQQREWETALTQLTMSIALKPDHLWSYYYRALVLVELNHQQKALNDLEKALEINPEQSSVINLYNRIKKSLDSE